MIRGAEDAKLEIEVLEREGRFIAGLEWHFQGLLQQLEEEERALTRSLLGSSLPESLEALAGPGELQGGGAAQRGGRSHRGTPPRSPKTPPLHALLGLDPLSPVTMPPLQLDDNASELDTECKSSSMEAGPPVKKARLDLKSDPGEGSTTEGPSSEASSSVR